VQARPSPPHVGGVVIRAEVPPEGVFILTEGALAFLATLHRRFETARQGLRDRRREVQARLDSGARPGFLDATSAIRSSDWTVAPPPADLQNRRVEITGPVDRKMIINALNSGANVFMADFEDSNAPTWSNCLLGHVNLHDAVTRTISFTKSNGEHYKLNQEIATLFVRPRGWHLDERHVTVDDQPISASLFDFGLYVYHNAADLMDRGTGPYFYLPKIENHLEARLWNDVFVFAQEVLGIPKGTIRATVLIENVLAAFEMDEILWELREHSAGLNCGRWDYIFSFIKMCREDAAAALPDRSQLAMDTTFLKSYCELLIQTCHRRGAHAIGGMSPHVPIKDDSAANAVAMESVRMDKLREVAAGHDGSWVAHPGLVPTVRMVFDQHMADVNQIHRLREDVAVSAQDLLEVPRGITTEAGLRKNVRVSIHYLAAWLSGTGCVPINNMMEDAATAEISRSQVWQWIRYGVETNDGARITADRVRQIVAEETADLEKNGVAERYGTEQVARARAIVEEMVTAPQLDEWLTVTALDYVD